MGPRRMGLLLLACILTTAAPRLGGAAEPISLRMRRTAPHAGYVYPAGGRVGTRFRISVGGQRLRQTHAVHMTGDGVTGSVRLWFPPARPLDGNQRRALRKRMSELRKRIKAGTSSADPAPKKEGAPVDDVLPKHPLLKDLEAKSSDELDDVERFFSRRRNPLQRKRSIEETVYVDVTIAADASPGMRELRLQTRAGLSNPLRFRVGGLPEVVESEPNNGPGQAGETLDLPVVVNGQVLPRDVDHFRFRARRGQRLVARAEARALVPYQADSVPGWMQATIALHDAEGREVGFADEYRYDPDPVLFFEVPEDGEYELVVRDALSRGRDDFVYRVAIGELPFVTNVFPLGGRAGALTKVELEGWNLSWTRAPFDTRAYGARIREIAWLQNERLTNEVRYAVDDLMEEVEQEPNDTLEQAPTFTLPRILNGRIGRAGDVDHFRFEGRVNDEIVAEVQARSLGSPLDATVRLLDEQGRVLAWNDDPEPCTLGVRGLGLGTHDADPRLRLRLPQSGTYVVQVADVRRQGGPGSAYRLRVSRPRPDVTVYLTPSSISARAGGIVNLTAYAVRRDGFKGPIDLELTGAPDGFELGGGQIPAGRDRVHMTLAVPRTGAGRPVPLLVVARTKDGRRTFERPVTPADNVMQAFLWRHLVPAQEMSVLVLGSRASLPKITLIQKKPARLARSGRAVVKFAVAGRVDLRVKDYEFVIVDPPAGISVGQVRVSNDGFSLELRASREVKREKLVDNLLIEVLRKASAPKKKTRKRSKGKKGKTAPRGASPVGLLPAIPYYVP